MCRQRGDSYKKAPHLIRGPSVSYLTGLQRRRFRQVDAVVPRRLDRLAVPEGVDGDRLTLRPLDADKGIDRHLLRFEACGVASVLMLQALHDTRRCLRDD